MKKTIFFLIGLALSSAVIFSQPATGALLEPNLLPKAQFTKAELLAFKDVKALLAAVNKGQDYASYLVRTFNLTTTISPIDSAQFKLSETGPGGQWSENQKKMIEKHAQKGTLFTIENLIMIDVGNKETKNGIVHQPPFSFSIKE